jgi:hypothetical protein
MRFMSSGSYVIPGATLWFPLEWLVAGEGCRSDSPADLLIVHKARLADQLIPHHYETIRAKPLHYRFLPALVSA